MILVRVVSRTCSGLFSARETVIADTPASFATSRMMNGRGVEPGSWTCGGTLFSFPAGPLAFGQRNSELPRTVSKDHDQLTRRTVQDWSEVPVTVQETALARSAEEPCAMVR